MKPLAELLRHLSRPGITELALASGRPPMVRNATGYEPVDPGALTTEELVKALQAMVGMARASTVSETPVQWTVNATGLGALSIAAVRRGELMNVRLTKSTEGAAQSAPPAAQAPAAAPAAPTRTPYGGMPAVSAPAEAIARTAQVGGPAPAAARAPAAPAAPARAPAVTAPVEAFARAPSAAPPAAPSAAAHGHAAPVAARAIPISRTTSAPGRDLAVLLEQARSMLASDLHVVAGRPPLFRLAGELQPQDTPLSPETVERLLLPIIPERLRHVLEKDGSVDFALDSEDTGRFRVNVNRQRTGLKGVFRVIPREIPTLESLGLPADIAKATHHHQGLIVLTGPSGHGKTSTLAALLDIINRETTHHVLTVEDPVEYVHPRKRALISQREVGSNTRTFASALKGSLREDPDVIVVGELRDTETVRMALAASETGHLLISTMNTPSAAKTIDRLIDLFPPADQGQVRLSLSSGLRLIVSQRLMPSADGKRMVAAAEVLPGSMALGNLIRDNKTFQIPSLQQRGKSLGIIRFEDSLADLAKSGKATLETVKGFAENPDEIEAMVTGKRPGAGATTVPAPATPQEGARMLSKVGSLLGKKGA
ncbi:PilT/PilU family type 4a pilus ATPase [Corallococcus praedator]|uniref:PilT/PilU family type 4a pilus ATPase n=1 Tax=Corallococcus praedator TaxID=2316724 RepID=A0ABX9QCQ7_9BACT|nr:MULTISPECIES: PilT/PilU family type 4a pilus ATPase [Corallococcus]RKH07346.1 PilT/PilU family type 4a pilus ATPase [Corallococcus sp. CA047B]RKH32329.1 PilT/PilU family type 4a pilus ATPase [Corallococcus sp. CA031C]RKH97384.1 PilT/PilU family type 4a pilus ATPase [Corallococcus praedator]